MQEKEISEKSSEASPASEDSSKSPTEAKPSSPPPWVVFKVGEKIPLKGFWFEVLGYGKNWELVLGCTGRTGKK